MIPVLAEGHQSLASKEYIAKPYKTKPTVSISKPTVIIIYGWS